MQRQYCGAAGRVENCQVAVFLSDASPAGHALIAHGAQVGPVIRDDDRCQHGRRDDIENPDDAQDGGPPNGRHRRRIVSLSSSLARLDKKVEYSDVLFRRNVGGGQ